VHYVATMRIALLSITSCLFACAVPIDIAGGPRNTTQRLDNRHLTDEMRAAVGDDPEALAQVGRIERREKISKVTLWGGLALLAGCIAVSASSNSSMGTSSDGQLGAVVGLCGTSIALEIATLVITPKKGSYSGVLRTYNRNHPSTPWTSPALGVTP
jgi:hypothetical protein